MLRLRGLRAPRWMCAVWMLTKITSSSPGSSQPLMVETRFWDILWTGQQKPSEMSKWWWNKCRSWTCFFSHVQMWGWNQPLDPVQWHTGEVCSFPRYWPGGGSFLPFPCTCGKQQRHEPPVQSVRASGCHGPGWPCTDERYVAGSPPVCPLKHLKCYIS